MMDLLVNFIGSMFTFSGRWILYDCFIPTLLGGVAITYPILVSSLFLRICVLLLPIPKTLLNIVAITLGIGVLWWYYETSISYFFILSTLIYLILMVIPPERRGVSVGGACVLFIVICELILMEPVELHKIRGSLLVVAMKLISLAFDCGTPITSGSTVKGQVLQVPDFFSYLSYALFPSSTVFGPYMTYSQHIQFTRGVPLSLSWLFNVGRSLMLFSLCLSMSMCVFPFMFEEPFWNRWFAAYSAAGSFRFSHYFVVLFSQCSVILVGAGYILTPSGEVDWNGHRIIHPLHVELPRSMQIVVTSWNIPMHHFLKNYVFKPAIGRIGRLGAVLLTFIASALLHGLNFQLAAVLLSLGMYAYIDSVFRYKLSKRFNACIQARPCTSNCTHRFKSNYPLVVCINFGFMLLTMFHLAYLGLMFGGSGDDGEMNEGYSMSHVLRKWGKLDYLSHWIALGTWIISVIL